MAEQEEAKMMLEPYRVLDLADEKGFLCGKILGDLGADVIKAERPGGDPSRNIGPFYHDIPDPEKSLYWFAYNSNKRSITLNIECADGQEIFKRLVKGADFVIESFPTGYMDDLGLGYSQLNEINPRVVMTSITPFGQVGPYSKYKGPDIVTLAMSGLMGLFGDLDRPPVRVSLPQSHMWGAAYAAMGTLIAHYYRELTGQGQHVDTSIQASMTTVSSPAPSFWPLTGEFKKREGRFITDRSSHEAVFPAYYPCENGYTTFLIYGGRRGAITMKGMIELLNKAGLATDYLKQKDWDNFLVGDTTQEDLDQIIKPVGEYLKNKPKREFFEEALERGMLGGYPVSTAEDIMEDPHLAARDIWQEVEHPELGAVITYPGFSFKSSEASMRIRRRAPLVGEHNEEVYIGELGYTKEELTTLKEAGVI